MWFKPFSSHIVWADSCIHMIHDIHEGPMFNIRHLQVCWGGPQLDTLENSTHAVSVVNKMANVLTSCGFDFLIFILKNSSGIEPSPSYFRVEDTSFGYYLPRITLFFWVGATLSVVRSISLFNRWKSL